MKEAANSTGSAIVESKELENSIFKSPIGHLLLDLIEPSLWAVDGFGTSRLRLLIKSLFDM